MKKRLIKILSLVVVLCFVCTFAVGCGDDSGDNNPENKLKATLEFTLINNDTEYMVSGCSEKALKVIIPTTYNGKPVTSIGEDAFEDCDLLKSIKIPNSVTSIDRYAFSDCDSLTSIKFNGATAEWNAITKGAGWNEYVPATEVVCSDGNVSLS